MSAVKLIGTTVCTYIDTGIQLPFYKKRSKKPLPSVYVGREPKRPAVCSHCFWVGTGSTVSSASSRKKPPAAISLPLHSWCSGRAMERNWQKKEKKRKNHRKNGHKFLAPPPYRGRKIPKNISWKIRTTKASLLETYTWNYDKFFVIKHILIQASPYPVGICTSLGTL